MYNIIIQDGENIAYTDIFDTIKMYSKKYTMQKYTHLLERLGLSQSERDIYLSLLSRPYQIVSDIVRETRYHRPMVYKSLRSLEADGLVEKSHLDGKRYYYHATDPDRLRQKLQSLTDAAERLIPELEELHMRNAEAPILSVKE